MTGDHNKPPGSSLFADIVSSIPTRIFWKDRDSRFLGCNALFARDAGVSSLQELVGKSDFDMPWKDRAKRIRSDDLEIMKSAMPKLGFEERRTTSDGRTVWLRTSKAPLFDADDNVIGVLGISEDITAQKTAEELQQASEERFHALFDQSPLAIQIVAADGCTLKVNPAWEKLWGVPFEALENYNLFTDNYLLENNLMPLVKKSLHGEAVLMPEVEYDKAATPEVFDQGADKVWVHTHIFPLTQTDGSVKEIVLLHEEVTERKRMERELAEQQAQHEVAQELAHFGHWSLDLVTNNLVWSDEVYRIFAIPPGSESNYETFLSRVHPGDAKFVNQAFKESVEKRTKYDIEHRLLLPDGTVKWVQERCKTWYAEDGTPLRAIGTVLDVTKRKKAELALHETMEKYHDLVETSCDWIWEVDEKDRYTYASHKVEEMLGYKPFELLGKTPFDFMPADEAKRVGKIFAEIARKREPFEGLENRNLHRDGHIVVLESSGTPFFDKDGKLLGYRGVDRDISGRKQAEEALKSSEARLQAFVSNLPGVVFLKDIDGRHLLVNKEAERIFGKSQEEVLGKTVSDLLPADVADVMAANDRKIIASKQPASMEERVQVDGQETIYESIKFPVFDADGEVVGSGGIAMDITGRKTLDDMLYFIAHREWEGKGDFFQTLATRLAESLKVDYVLINRLPDNARAKSVAFFCKGSIAENVEYLLRDTPCENVAGRQICYHPQDIQQLFPKDEMLVEMGAESYLGIPLWGGAGEPLGLIALLDSKPMENGPLAKSLLQAVAVQVAAELERQQYEKALLESKIRAETLFGAITDAIFVHEVGKDGHVGKFIEVNDVACQKLGYSREELLDLTPIDIDAPESGVDLEPLVEKLFAGESVTFEQVHVSKDGRRIPVEIHASLFDLRGKTAVISLVRDISERQLQEKSLHRQLRRNELILETTQDGFWAVAMDGRLVEVNDTYCRLSGYSRDELLEMTFGNIEANENPDQTAAHMQKVLKEGHDCFETRHRCKDGSLIDLEISVSVIEEGGEKLLVAFLRDIGERRQAEEVRHRFEHIVSTSTDILALLDKNFVYLAVNPAYLEAWEKSRDEMVGRPAIEVVGEEFFETWMKPHALRCLAGESVNFQAWYQYPAYEPRYMDFNYFPYTDAQGEVIGFAINGRNITLRHKSEQELQQTMHSLGERMKELRCLYSLSRLAESETGSLVEFMQEAVELLPPGWQYPEITCARILFEGHEFCSENFACSQWCLSRPIVVGGKECGRVQVCYLEQMPELDGTPFLKEEEELIEAIATQLARKIKHRKLEEELRQAQKLEAIGTLVGGIAHDFNNMLAAIKGNVYLARLQQKKKAPIEDRLENIEQAATGAADMVRQLLAFARKDITATSVFSLNSFLRESEKMVKTLVPESIECEIKLCRKELPVRGDANQLKQVLLNLFNNARDAVAEVSRPKISCSLAPFKADEAFHQRHPELRQEKFACWTVSDNGCGISMEQQERIYEPFFTTKEVDKGTGLGLAMVFGTIKNHGGVIELESAEGEGTTFHIYLPVSTEAVTESGESRHVRLKGKGETILLADDEESVRSSTCSVLESLGYKVLEAADGETALQIFGKHKGKIDLLMTDVVMPKLNGPDLLLKVRESKADLPVILVTGYDRGKMLDEHLNMERCEAINKPYSFDELSQLLRQLLDAA